jgi:predicted amidohydrolase
MSASSVSRDAAQTLHVACIQLTSSANKEANIASAEALIDGAVRAGAALVVLPEHWNTTGDADILRSSAETRAAGPSIEAMSQWARRWQVTLVGGPIIERDDAIGAFFNTSFVFGPDGGIIGAYRKIHLFDVDVGGRRYRESEVTISGHELVLVRAAGWSIGVSLCYDVRFPELYRALAVRGADAIVVPASFTVPTGMDHWHILLRARAVENQVYVLAAGQCGEIAPGKRAYGRSLICDPWGILLAQAADEETFIAATCRRERIAAVRSSLPALDHRRPDVYAGWSQSRLRACKAP